MVARLFCTLNRRVANRGLDTFNLYGRTFHCSGRRQQLFLLEIASALNGRLLRYWWLGLPKKEQVYYKTMYGRLPRSLFTFLCCVFGVHYIYNTEVTPETNRKRFMMFKPQPVGKSEAEAMDRLISKFFTTLPMSDPKYDQFSRGVARLVEANADIQCVRSLNWRLTIVDSENVRFVTPDGHIVISKTTLGKTLDEEKMAQVVAREMAHVHLYHTTELDSLQVFMEMISIYCITIVWAIIAKVPLAALSHSSIYLVQLLILLNLRSKQDVEADHVGRMMMRKAGCDVRNYVDGK